MEVAAVDDLSKQEDELGLGLQSKSSTQWIDVPIESLSKKFQILGLEENTNCTEMDSASNEVEEKDSDSKEQEEMNDSLSKEEEMKDSRSDEEEEMNDSRSKKEELNDSGSKEEEEMKDSGSKEEEMKDSCSNKEEEKGFVETGSALKEVKEQDSDLQEEEEKDSDPKEEKNEIVFLYPVRPDEPDCSYYLRTGMCRFGSNCKFNHPPRQKNQVGMEGSENVKEKEKGEGQETEKDEEKENETENENEDLPHFPEREGQPECKYYLKTGGCKFGKSCRYNHPRSKAGVGEPVDLNFVGLPIRPGQKECPFYMRTGSCKFATNCKFHHPDPTAVGGCDPSPVYRNDNSLTLHASTPPPPPLPTAWPRTSSNEPVSYIEAPPSPYVPVMLPPPHGVHPRPDWNGFMGPGSTMFPLERHLKQPSASAMFDMTNKADSSTRQLQTMVDEFPERPGQPDCQFYMRNGNCKFRSACRYHHPKPRVSKPPGCVLSSRGLPMRPDQIICSHYSRFGICKFGPSCKYDHPIDCVPASAPATPASDLPTLGKSSEEAGVHT